MERTPSPKLTAFLFQALNVFAVKSNVIHVLYLLPVGIFGFSFQKEDAHQKERVGLPVAISFKKN
jgi:hypothetical protein